MENEKNKASFIIFIIIIILFIFGGYLGMNYLLHKPIVNEKKDEVKTVDYRLDQTKDYVYFNNETRVLSYLEIDYEDITINIKGAESINNELNNEENNYRNSLKYVKDMDITDDNYEANEEGIYSLSYREYEVYEYKDYLSVLVKDFNYDVYKLNEATLVKAYLYNKSNGNKISEEELLKDKDLSLDVIKNKIKIKLTALQTKDDNGNDILKIDETLNNLKYAVFINKIGKLEICYIVKSTNQTYYDNIVFE